MYVFILIITIDIQIRILYTEYTEPTRFVWEKKHLLSNTPARCTPPYSYLPITFPANNWLPRQSRMCSDAIETINTVEKWSGITSWIWRVLCFSDTSYYQREMHRNVFGWVFTNRNSTSCSGDETD